ncbi:MAG: hypothetical protein ACKVIB_12205 [Pseudomonadales bacterium]
MSGAISMLAGRPEEDVFAQDRLACGAQVHKGNGFWVPALSRQFDI